MSQEKRGLRGRESWKPRHVRGTYHLPVVLIGRGLYVNLPKVFVDRYDVEKGDLLLVQFIELVKETPDTTVSP